MATVIPAPARRPQRSEVRTRILGAAKDAFLDHGYQRTSVAEIAAAAGFTKGAVYSNFGSKEELFAEFCRIEFDEATSRLLADLVRTTQQGRRLSADAALHLGALVVEHSAFQCATDEFRSLAGRSAEISAIYSALREDQLSRLSTELRDLDLLGTDADPDHYRPLAVTLLAMLNALALEHRAAPTVYPLDDLVATMSLLIRGLLP